MSRTQARGTTVISTQGSEKGMPQKEEPEHHSPCPPCLSVDRTKEWNHYHHVCRLSLSLSLVCADPECNDPIGFYSSL